MEDNDNESLIPKRRLQGYRKSVNCYPDGDEIVAEICGNQPNPNEPFASSENETIDEDRGNPSLQTRGNCSATQFTGVTSKASIATWIVGATIAIFAPPIIVNSLDRVSDDSEKEMYVAIVLIVSHLFGALPVAILGKIRPKGERIECFNRRGISFLKMKLISMYFFGTCYFLHCGLYIWKHILEHVNRELGIICYVMTAIHVFCLFVYFVVFYRRKCESTYCNTFLSVVAIIFTNIGTWIDALSSGYLFKSHSNSSLPVQNLTRAMETLEETEPLVSSAIISFSLLTISLLFPKAVDTCTFSKSYSKKVDSTPKNDTAFYNQIIRTCKIIFQIFFLLLSFGLVAFTFTELLTEESSADLKAYIITQIVFKSIILLLVLINCICFFGKRMIKCLLCTECKNCSNICKSVGKILCFNAWMVMFVITGIGNVSYHVACGICINDIQDIEIDIYVIVEIIISIIAAVLQSFFIIGTYYNVKCENCDDSIRYVCVASRCKEFVYFACSLLGILNMGLWISDSISKENLIYKVDDNDFWNLFKNVTLLLTTFFRFQTSLEFLKLYWHQEKRERKKDRKKRNS